MAALATVPDLAMDYEISLRPELIVDTHAHEAWTAVDEGPGSRSTCSTWPRITAARRRAAMHVRDAMTQALLRALAGGVSDLAVAS
jgi:hypothetical protein